MPPAILVNTKAETMDAAIHARLPIPLGEIKRKCKCLSIAVLTDSAKSCFRFSKSVRNRTQITADGDGVISVWVPCLMHRVALGIFAMLKMFQWTVPLFCVAALAHQAN
eukprot:8742509-Pyramimonas_sp.AAC.1